MPADEQHRHELMIKPNTGERVIVVSNRLPITLKRAGDRWQAKKSAGGLATAMQPVLEASKGIWIGWTGDTTTGDPKREALLKDWADNTAIMASIWSQPPHTVSMKELPIKFCGRSFTTSLH